MQINYTKINDYEILNLILEDKNKGTINKYGLLKLHYLKENNKPLYTTLLIKNELTNYLVSVGVETENRLNILMENYKEADKKLSEKSKEINQIECGKLMNNYKNMAEEIVLNEYIFK